MSWRCNCAEAGLDVLFRHGRKLVRDRTTRLSVVRVTKSKFSDNVALYTTSRDSLESMARKFVGGASKWELTVSIEKTKGMAAGEQLSEEDVAPIQVEGGVIEMMGHFAYLCRRPILSSKLSDSVVPTLTSASMPSWKDFTILNILGGNPHCSNTCHSCSLGTES